MAATAGSVPAHGARFAAACDALSQYVKAASAVATTVGVVLPLMPGADLSMSTQEAADHQAGPGPAAPSAQQLTISYGGQVVVVDGVPADKAAELLRLAAAGAAPRVLRKDDLPMARKASLRQFMEKRKGRVAARGSPYSRPASFPDHLALTL